MKMQFLEYLLSLLSCTILSLAEKETSGLGNHHRSTVNSKSQYKYSAVPFRPDINQEEEELNPAHGYLSTRHANFDAKDGPLADAALLSHTLGIPQKHLHYNHPDHLPVNPYIALLLSHYGKYIPIYGAGYGIYAYNAVNNYHNNKPFGSYKVHENM